MVLYAAIAAISITAKGKAGIRDVAHAVKKRRLLLLKRCFIVVKFH